MSIVGAGEKAKERTRGLIDYFFSFFPLCDHWKIGYGQTGPYASRPGYDVMIEAEAGLMYITGEEQGPPVKVGVAVTGKNLLFPLWLCIELGTTRTKNSEANDGYDSHNKLT